MPEPHPHSDRSSLTYHNQQPDPTQETSPESGVNTRESKLSLDVFTPLILEKVVKPGKQLFLTLTFDRTHWKFGQTHLNLLCLGVLHQDVSIPPRVYFVR